MANDDRRANGGEHQKPRRQIPLGQRRLEWIAGMNAKYSTVPILIRAAGAIGWEFTDSKTGETEVSAPELAKFIKCSERSAAQAFATFTADGRLVTVGQSKRSKGAIRRIAFPPEESAKTVAPRDGKASPRIALTATPPSPPAQPPTPTTEAEYLAHLRYWRTVENDDEYKARWPAEKELRFPIWGGKEFSVLKNLKTEFENLLAKGPSKPSEPNNGGIADKIIF
jgi:hypothetical protein